MVDSMGDRIRNAEVTADDLKTALLAINKLDSEDRRDITGRALAVMRAFGLLDEPPGQGGDEPPSDDELSRVDKVTMTQIRLRALAELVEDQKFKAWSFEVKGDGDNDGFVMMREDVLTAAAETPLLETEDGRSYFDPEAFFEKLLTISEEAGKS